MFLFSLARVVLLPALAFAASQANQRLFGWIPLPTLRPTSTTQAASTSNSIFQNAVTSEINSLRYSFQAQPVTWNATLATNAATCARDHVSGGTLTQCNSCGSNAAETAGISGNPVPSQGARAIMSNPGGNGVVAQTLAWYAALNDPLGDGVECIDWSSPAFSSSCSSFTQLIWQSTTQFGCAYSNTTSTMFTDATGVPAYAFSCCWWPAGNIPGTFADNVKQDTA